MSWGERSCVFLYKEKIPCKPKLPTCNVSCPYYQWDGKTNPDSLLDNGARSSSETKFKRMVDEIMGGGL